VNTEGKSINNSEANIQFPTDMIEVVSITKSSSIFSLWVEEPSFSNTTGKITFNGGVPNPGYNGATGYIATITFKAKKQGTASVIFTEGAVRENDGLGTDILNSKNGSVIQIGVAQVAPIPIPNTVNEKSTIPVKPTIVSETHPDEDLWYSNNTATFSWKIPSGVTSLQTLFNKIPNATPSITYDNSVSQKTLNNLSDGTSYFHLRYINSSGSGLIAHYKVNIDTNPPQDFSPTTRILGSKNLLKLEAKDTTSGIDYYQIGIDESPLIKVTKENINNGEYLLPVLNEGDHKLTIIAYDKAGNKNQTSLIIQVPVIFIPELSLSQSEIISGDTVTISGKTDYPKTEIQVIVESNGDILKEYSQITADDGSFSLITDEIKKVGSVSIYARSIFSDTVMSNYSDKYYLKVSETEALRVTLSIVFPLLYIIVIIALLLIILIILYWGWHKYFGLKKKIKDEARQTTVEIHKAMLLLEDELNDQLEKLEKIKVDRTLNDKEELIFREIEKNIEEVDNFIEKKLKKIL
jgi:hypothetical protein